MSEPRYVGLDVGISTTDLVAEWARYDPLTVATRGFAESATAAVERLLATRPPPDDRPVVVAATGVGAHRLSDPFCSLRLRQVPEIDAIGVGGVATAGLDEALVVSLGTGTAMVSVRAGQRRHIVPGTGVGGGTLLALGRALLGVDDLTAFERLARRGDRSLVDLTIGEVAGGPLGALPADATASNLAKWTPGARAEDTAAALAHLVGDVVLAVTLLGLQISGQGRAVLVGKLPQFAPIGERIGSLPAGLRELFVVPAQGGFATAIGALAVAREGDAG